MSFQKEYMNHIWLSPSGGHVYLSLNCILYDRYVNNLPVISHGNDNGRKGDQNGK